MPNEKAGFVLSDFPAAGAVEWEETIERAARAVQSIIADGVSRAMSMFNA
jgi:peptidyl-tRNA hydrolase